MSVTNTIEIPTNPENSTYNTTVSIFTDNKTWNRKKLGPKRFNKIVKKILQCSGSGQT